MERKLIFFNQLKPPAWTWQSVTGALVFTILIFVLLPMLEKLSIQPKSHKIFSHIDTVKLPPSPLRPERNMQEENTLKDKLPKPKLQRAQRKLPMNAVMNLNWAFNDIGGDFNLNFEVAPHNIMSLGGDMIFELSDLDEPPLPLSRLKPMYPPQMQARQLEGAVNVEFVVKTNGRTENIKVISSYPGTIFVRAAIQAITRWQFKPGTRNDVPVPVRVQQKISFKLEDS